MSTRVRFSIYNIEAQLFSIDWVNFKPKSTFSSDVANVSFYQHGKVFNI